MIVLALTVLSLPSACQTMEQTAQKLRSPDGNIRRQAIDEIPAFGVKAIPTLLSIIEDPKAEPGTTMAAMMALEKVVYQSTRPGAASEHRSAEQQLIARLQKPAPESLQRFLLRLITVVGTARSVPTLQKLLNDKTLREPARMALQEIPGKEATVALERAFIQASDPQWKSALLLALGARRQPSSTKLVLNALKSSQAQLRLTAITVAGEFPTADIQKALQQIAQKGSEREKQAAQQSLVRIAERLRRSAATERAASLFQWLFVNGQTPAVRCAGMVGLAQTTGTKSANLLFKALKHPNPSIANTAYSLLQQLSPSSLAEALVVQLQNARGEHRLRLIELLGYQSVAPQAVLPALLNAFSDNDVNVKTAAIQAMGRLRHPDAASALMVALGSESELVQQAAIQAVPGIALALQKVGKSDVATVLARTALERARDRESVIQLVGVLNGLGTNMNTRDVAMQQGLITNWWVVGPVAPRDQMRQRDFIDPAEPVNPQKNVNGAHWRRVEIDDPVGVLDFNQVFGQHENTGAYAYTEVYSDNPQQVQLRIGSDDDVICWVNGQKVHEYIGDRGLTPNQDTITVNLQQGWNRILCKVLNGAGGWQLTMRIVAPNGRPLRLQQR